MLMPIQDVLLLILLAGAIGLCAGAIGVCGGYRLAAHLAKSRQPHVAGVGETSSAESVTASPGRGSEPLHRRAPLQQEQRAMPVDPRLPQVADLLLVDDSAVARTKLRRLFEAAGYRVHLASDGVEALAQLAKGGYGMLITDLEMPNMDGVALIEACRRQPQIAQMPILAITGHESLRAKFNECRYVCGIHRKPWVDDILLSHVATLVSARRVQAPALVD